MASLILRLRYRNLKHLPITKEHTIIGRDPGCDLIIDNPAISARHARVSYCEEEDNFTVFDNGSVNGIGVNGKPVGWLRLTDGACIDIGKFTVTFVEEGGVYPDQLKPVTLIEGDLLTAPGSTTVTGMVMQPVAQLPSMSGKPVKKRIDTIDTTETAQKHGGLGTGALIVAILFNAILAGIIAYLVNK